MKKVKGSCGQTPRVGKKGDAKVLTLAGIIAVSLYVGSLCGIVKPIDKDHEFVASPKGMNTYTIKMYSDMTDAEKLVCDKNDPYSDKFDAFGGLNE